MNKFQIGDLVIADNLQKNRNPSLDANSVGIVVGYSYSYSDLVNVDWQRHVHDGHSCDKKCEYGNGWNVREYEIGHYNKPAEIAIDEYL